MNYIEAMDYIHKVGNFGSNYGLGRIERLLELLGNPQNELKIIHIGGTNGKGSTTTMVTTMLMEEGYKVGMYTSPFLEEFEERIQINRKNIDKDDLAFYVTKVESVVGKVINEGLGNPTEFEIITCVMFVYFKEKNVDYAVVEVGLGGTLDATNVAIPVVEALASISLDHINILGETIKEIAGEKCGIIKKDRPLIVYPQCKEAMDVIEKVAKEKNAKIIKVLKEDCEFIEIIEDDEKVYQKVKVKGINKVYEYKMSLLGEHQILNGALAIKIVETILNLEGKELKNVDKAMENARWNGRLEILGNNPRVVIDGAHNIDGIENLKRNISKYFKYDNLYLLIGILADKQVEAMVNVITKDAKEIVALTPNSDRAEIAEQLKGEIEKVNKNVVSFEDYEKGFKYIYEKAGANDLVLATGSLYMIGEIRGIIKKYLKENTK